MFVTRTAQSQSSGTPLKSDTGFSLVEVLVAMFVLAGLALTLAPALVAALKQNAQNQIVASATHQLSSQMDQARLQTPTCQSLQLFVAQAVADAPGGQTGPSGSQLQIHTNQTLGACPSQYPGTVRLTITVTRTDTSAVVVTNTGLIYLASAS